MAPLNRSKSVLTIDMLEVAKRSLKERLHNIDHVIGTVDNAKIAPFIERKTWMRDIEGNHVADVNIGAFFDL